MPRRLLVCCDGTNNQFGTRNTNVVRLVQVLAESPSLQQLVFYEPGVGTMPEPDVRTRIGRKVAKLVDFAFATGLPGKVQRAYTYLMDVWEPGDEVFLFGFSRGAYTARVLAGWLHLMGLLPPRSQNLVPYAWRLFAASRRGQEGEDDPYWRLCSQFRATFARPIKGSEHRHFPIRFLGLWDTVSSVGWIWDPKTFPYTAKNPGIAKVRQAIALDERRAFYRQNRLQPVAGQDFDEVWFAGAHSDIGGGYPEDEGGLWAPPFQWIVQAARDAGLEVCPARLAKVLDRARTLSGQADVHTSLYDGWWLLEVLPKIRDGRPHLNLGRRRRIREGTQLHHSLAALIHGGEYAPQNLSPTFRAAMRNQLPPGNVAYASSPVHAEGRRAAQR